MATTPERQAHAVVALRSLHGQVDALHLYFNGPSAAMDPRTWVALEALDVAVHFGPDGDLTDLGKFWPRHIGAVRLAVDDDLVYPPDYAQAVADGMARHPGAIVTFHGSNLLPGGRSYYKSRQTYRCLGTVAEDVPVMVGGTGVMGIPEGMDVMPEEPWPYMADLVVARYARERGIPLWVLRHDEGWLLHQDIDHTTTIYSRFARSDEFQTWFAARYL